MKEEQQILEDAFCWVSKNVIKTEVRIKQEITEFDPLQGLVNKAAMEVEKEPDQLGNDSRGEFLSTGTLEVFIKDEASEKGNSVDEDPLAWEKLGRNTTPQTKHICQECGKELSRKDSLENHMAIHEGGRRTYQCDLPGCGQTFLHFTSVKRHKLFMHSDTDRQKDIFECDWPGCPKKFSRKGDVRKHMVVHTGERPHKCPEEGCDKAFGRKTLLVKHLVTHSTEKPFKCLEPNCGNLFSQKFSLDRHKVMHTGEKPYKCMLLGCDKAFRYKRQFKTHNERHHGIKMIAVKEEMLIMNEAVKEEAITEEYVVCGKKKKSFEKASVKQEAVLEEEKEVVIKKESVNEEELVIKEEVIVKEEVVIEEIAPEEKVLEGTFW